MKFFGFALFALLALAVSPGQAFADDLNSGDTAWMLTATALVLFMTIPGLALFYGGLVRVKNVLSVNVNWAGDTVASPVSAETACRVRFPRPCSSPSR